MVLVKLLSVSKVFIRSASNPFSLFLRFLFRVLFFNRFYFNLLVLFIFCIMPTDTLAGNTCLFVIIFLVLAAANGVVIATEKKLPSILVDEASVSCCSLDQFLYIVISEIKIWNCLLQDCIQFGCAIVFCTPLKLISIFI